MIFSFPCNIMQVSPKLPGIIVITINGVAIAS